MLSGTYWKVPYYLGLTKVPTAPLYVNVEPAASCNLRCGFCSSRRRDDREARMDMTLFERIVADAKRAGVVNISLWLAGEPLMHPRLVEMVAYVEKMGLVSGLHTNATLLGERNAKGLLDAGLSQLSISFDGTDRESYEQMRLGANFDKTVANIRRFLRLKAERGTGKPHTIIQTMVPYRPEMRDASGWVHYPPAPPEVRNLFAGLPVDEFRVLLPHNWAGEIEADGWLAAARARVPPLPASVDGPQRRLGRPRARLLHRPQRGVDPRRPGEGRQHRGDLERRTNAQAALAAPQGALPRDTALPRLHAGLGERASPAHRLAAVPARSAPHRPPASPARAARATWSTLGRHEEPGRKH